MKHRCKWCTEDPLYIRYHDEEWGIPVHDDHRLFEFLIVEGAQAGLSWITILRKREAYREALENFDFQKIATYGQKEKEKLLGNSGIVRNRLKIDSLIKNAKAFIRIREEFDSFDHYLWKYVDGKPIQNQWEDIDQIPTKTDLSDRLSKDLKKRGFNFVGSTICYAFMQAVGIVNDHTIDCFRYQMTK